MQLRQLKNTSQMLVWTPAGTRCCCSGITANFPLISLRGRNSLSTSCKKIKLFNLADRSWKQNCVCVFPRIWTCQLWELFVKQHTQVAVTPSTFSTTTESGSPWSPSEEARAFLTQSTARILPGCYSPRVLQPSLHYTRTFRTTGFNIISNKILSRNTVIKWLH